MSLTFIDAASGSRRIPDLTPQAEVSVLARALWREGYDDINVGHLTYKLPDDTFLVLAAEVGWDEARPQDVLRIDIDGNLLDGAGTVVPPIILHLEYHKLHPECTWTVHHHPRYATIWASLGRIPPAYSQKGTSLGDSIGLYNDYKGGVGALDAARSAAEGIGDAKAVLLLNHGVFVVGDDVRQVFTRALALEGRCRIAWHVEAVGGGREMPEYGQRALIEQNRTMFNFSAPGLWEWAVRRELRAEPDLLS